VVLDLARELEGGVRLVQMDKDPVQRQDPAAEVAAAQAHLVHVVRASPLIHVILCLLLLLIAIAVIVIVVKMILKKWSSQNYKYKEPDM
jgi:t-SNARE complex subunit (syntaxin)